MIKIRNGCFETNSSSSHALVFCTEDTWKNFLSGNLIYNVLYKKNGYPQFCTFKDVKKYIREEIENIPFPENWRDMSKEQLKAYLEKERYHKLCFFEITFYSIDELKGYKYDSKKGQAELDYYFG